jgi:hypothetical protein
MDFIIGLPPAKIRTREVINTILVIVNRYIKSLKYFVIIIIITAAAVAAAAAKLVDLFLKQWLLFSTLRGIISNRGTVFNNAF